MMSDENNTPPEETPPEQPQPEQVPPEQVPPEEPAPEAPPEEAPPAPLPPVMKPDQTTEDPPPSRTVGGAHDLSDHPAVSSGVIKNPGDTVIGRDPDAPSFRRPPVEDPEAQVDRSGRRETTTANPAKKASRGKSKGDGAGPES